MGNRPRAAISCLRFLVAFGLRHHDYQRMGNAEDGGNWRESRNPVEGWLRPLAACVGSAKASSPSNIGFGRRVPNGSRASPGARSESGLWISWRSGIAERFVRFDLGLASRQWQMGHNESDR